MTSVALIGCYLEHRYWPAVYAAVRAAAQCDTAAGEPAASELAASEPAAGEPAASEPAPFSGFDPQAISKVSAAELREWQDSALKRPTAVSDTHPSLADRLEALGECAAFAPPDAGGGADRLLGGALPAIEHALDQRWRKRVAKSRATRSCRQKPV